MKTKARRVLEGKKREQAGTCIWKISPEYKNKSARKTGKRLRQMTDGLKSDHYGEIKVKWKKVISSTMLRACETAEIIAEELGVEVDDRDSILNEGNPCMNHPGTPDLDVVFSFSFDSQNRQHPLERFPLSDLLL